MYEFHEYDLEPLNELPPLNAQHDDDEIICIPDADGNCRHYLRIL